MGFADLLVDLGIAYNTAEAVAQAEKVMKFIQEEGRKFSAFLARSGGVPQLCRQHLRQARRFARAQCHGHHHRPNRHPQHDRDLLKRVEPLFALVYQKNVLDGTSFMEVHKDSRPWPKRKGSTPKS